MKNRSPVYKVYLVQLCLIFSITKIGSSNAGPWRVLNLEDDYYRMDQQDSRSFVETLIIDGNKEVDAIDFSWKSTGLCPPLPHQQADKFLLSQDMVQNLAYIGAIPHSGIEQVRIHWLLDLVKVSRFENGIPVYNFSRLDDLVQTLWINGLRPGFELMGNPSNIFFDFENKTQVFMWRDLVHTLAKNYIDQYGLGYVSTWNFETWNEPDHRDFDGLNLTVQGFLNYYDACSEGLRQASPQLRLGGPGASCRQASFSKRCWALLEHVSNGTNYFTGEKGIRIDFISFHKKGGKMQPVTSSIVTSEYETMLKIYNDYPLLRKVQVFNDEGDPLVGWSKPQTWRADARYAAMVAKVIIEHQNLHKQDIPMNFTLLSNDNAFLSFNPAFFKQRTLLARFQMNNTNPPHVQFIRKPVHSVMGLLSLVGEKTLSVNYAGQYLGLGGLASLHIPKDNTPTDNVDLSVLVVHSLDIEEGPHNASVKVVITEPSVMRTKELVMVQYQIDQKNGNPYSIWLKRNKPFTPSWQDFKSMRTAEGVVRIHGPAHFQFDNGVASFNISVPLPGVYFAHICAKPAAQPDQVPNLTVLNVTAGVVLITWSDSCVHSRCLLTYELEYSATNNRNFNRINLKDDIFTVFVYSPHQEPSKAEVMVRGYYRVRATDYWGRSGEFSLVVPYGE